MTHTAGLPWTHLGASRLAMLLVACAALPACPAGCPAGPDPTPDSGPPGVTLTVTKTGDGTGTFRSEPDGIDCDGACPSQTIELAPGAALSLVVEPARDANLIDALCGVTFPDNGTDERVLVDDTIAAVAAEDPGGTEINCSAEFRQVHTLQVLFSGTGSGSVLGTLTDQAGDGGTPRVDCPPECVGAYFVGETETLTPTADPGSVFVEWKVDCSGTNAATLIMTEDKNCEAAFDLQ